MTNPQSTRLQKLVETNQQHLLIGGLKGIEKESLRIDRSGVISQKPHPLALGSALTHPHITTDYSEALIELITPPFQDVRETLASLETIHKYVYKHLEDEILLCSSMPCGIQGDESIPIARYGSSNTGRMKHIYRHGLWHRYGRTMQAIAGIHFNFSVPESLWPVLQSQENSSLSPDEFIAAGYFGLVRNFLRFGWLILYLFGASPAICKSFFRSRPQLMDQFEEFDQGTLYHPYATSLRMSDIGYKSKNQANLRINYNSLSEYVDSLSKAIATPFPEYEQIGVKMDGEYQQLNTNVLQIENEFYSTIRPKQIAKSGEKPTLALKRRGVRYVEMRSLDLDLFSPVGIDESKARFIEALLLTCLLHDSPPMTEAEFQQINRNQLAVANHGRRHGLELERTCGKITLKDWALEILASMKEVSQILDDNNIDKPYSSALAAKEKLVLQPELTPSAKILAIMAETGLPFSRFAVQKSLEHATYFEQNPLSAETICKFDEFAQQSLAKQAGLESAPQLPFDEFLAQYFAQQ